MDVLRPKMGFGEPSGAAGLPRVLMLTHRLPYPPDRGDRIRTYHLLRELGRHVEVSLAAVSQAPIHSEQRAALENLTGGRLLIQNVHPWRTQARAATALVRGEAATPAALFHPGLSRKIVDWHVAQPFDAVLTVCTSMLGYARRLCHPMHRDPRVVRPPRCHVLDMVDLDSRKWADYAATAHQPMKRIYATEAVRLRRIELAKRDFFDAITLVSDAELQAYRDLGGTHPGAMSVTNGVDLDYFRPQHPGDSRTVIFVGVLDYPPNVEAVTWFADEVLPRLRKKIPRARLKLVGRDPSPAVRKLGERRGVRLVGPVDDVRPHLLKAAAVVAPLRFAPGVQNKVLEAMACGKAVVCSPGAAEGIDADPGRHLLVAESPRDYMKHLARLLSDQRVRDRVGDAARLRMELGYDWPTTLAPMVELLRGRSIRSEYPLPVAA